MNTQEVIERIDAEIAKLQQARVLPLVRLSPRCAVNKPQEATAEVGDCP